MTQQRRHFTAKFKFQLALEALKELKTLSEIASLYCSLWGLFKATR